MADDLGVCDLCGQSPWIHYLRGGYLYCDEVGGIQSSFSLAQVNEVRLTIGKKKIYTPRPLKKEKDNDVGR